MAYGLVCALGAAVLVSMAGLRSETRTSSLALDALPADSLQVNAKVTVSNRYTRTKGPVRSQKHYKFLLSDVLMEPYLNTTMTITGAPLSWTYR